MVPSGEPGIFFGGTVNWLAYSNSGLPAIISFNLGIESYKEISQPDYGMFVKLTMCMLRDCLCIVSHSDSFNDVWLLMDYENQESWVKLIRLPYFGGDHGYYAHGPKIVYISEDDDHVLLMFKEFAKLKWVVYDCKNSTIKTIKIQDFSWVDSMVYIESLVSP
ncbi:putative F-box associated interaction domain-containing protein [Medicago truncatula]|uniref:F-box protein interaction domain protein n=1 Tax=Medicago truncatula TaxID=3880 RepID=A0A072VJQ2_MEDTR|nr:F-box/kelch-repeat protein At3g23880 [Medicago truncatula]KEH41821.1 F-box protein interaction domain protein [Medicago truncatula]RHN79364.1 putative F-box associated interaction domain-containing protein [Medicago truncatula]